MSHPDLIVRVRISNAERSRFNVRVGDVPAQYQDGVCVFQVIAFEDPGDFSDSVVLVLRKVR